MTAEQTTWHADAPTLPMVLAAPLQSWGHHSVFRQRNTLSFPTHSALVGIIAAASAVDRNDPDHSRKIRELSAFHTLVCRVPRRRSQHRIAPVLEDYHTVQNARTATGGIKETELTRRFYLQDAVFVALIQGPQSLLERATAALGNPVWGGWLGRRACVPSIPMLPPGVWPATSAHVAWSGLRNLLTRFCPSLDVPERWERLHRIVPADSFADGTDSWLDVPDGFQNHSRRHNARRVRVILGDVPSVAEGAVDHFPSPLDSLDDGPVET